MVNSELSSRVAEVLQRLDRGVEKVYETKDDSEMADTLRPTREAWEDDDEEEYTPPACSLFHLPQNNKSSVALSLLHSAGLENSLRRMTQTSNDCTDDDWDNEPSIGPDQEFMERIAKQEQYFAAQHLRLARSRIRQESSNAKVKGIETPTPPHVSPKIREKERLLELRDDPKAQLLDVLYGDPSWTGQRIIREAELEAELGLK